MKNKRLILSVASFVVVLLIIAGGYLYYSPKIISQPPLDTNEKVVFFIEGETFPYQPKVRFDIPVTWHLTISPTTTDGCQHQVSIDPDTGKIIWSDRCKGVWLVTIIASNWAGKDSQAFNVKHIIKPFIKINLPSSIPALQDFNGSIDVSGSQPINLSCSNPDIRIEDIDSSKPKASFYWEKPKPGKYSIRFTASNQAGRYSVDWNVTVRREPVKITSEPQRITIAGMDYKYQVSVVGTPEFRWQLEDAPEGMSINEKGTVLLPADFAKVGNYNVKIKVSNIVEGKTYTDTQTFILQCKKKEEKEVKKQKKQYRKLANVYIKKVFIEEDNVIEERNKTQDQERLRRKELQKQSKPEQEKAIDAQKEVIKKAKEERQHIETERLKEIPHQQKEVEGQKAEKAQKEAEQQEIQRKEKEIRKKDEEVYKKYLEAQRKAREEAKKKEEELARQREMQRRAPKAEEKAKREMALRLEEMRKRQDEAPRKQEEARRKEQQRMKEAAEKARLEQKKLAERIKRQKELRKQAKEAERIAERQQKIEEESRKQRMTRKISVPTKEDMSQDKIERGKKIDLSYDFVTTGWSFTDLLRLAKRCGFKILFISKYKPIQPENYEVTGLDSNGDPVVEMSRWDDEHYPGKGCIVSEIPTEGEGLWKDYDTKLRKKLRLGSHAMTLFFPYHFFTYLEDAAISYYNARRIDPAIPFKQGAGKIKFTITKDYKFKILSMGNTRK